MEQVLPCHSPLCFLIHIQILLLSSACCTAFFWKHYFHFDLHIVLPEAWIMTGLIQVEV